MEISSERQRGRTVRMLEDCEVRKMKEYVAPKESKQQEEEVYLVCSKTEAITINTGVIRYQWVYYLAASNGGTIANNSSCTDSVTLERYGTTYTLHNYSSSTPGSIIQSTPSTSSDPSGTLHIPAGYYLIDGAECAAQDIVV